MSYTISSIDDLEALYGSPMGITLTKETPIINKAYRQLIEAAPFLAIASIGPEGTDCSPRGDGPGFVKILDDRTVAIPDRRGNNRIDTLRNIVRDGRVSLLFLIPGMNETLRINGHATVSVDPELLQEFEVQGKRPTSTIIVKIDTMYFQCARALKRSNLWDETRHVDRTALPSAGELLKSVMTDFDDKSYDANLQDRQKRTMY